MMDEEKEMRRTYKDTVFRMLFSEKENLLSLYNAVNGTDYKHPEDLEINTLENAIYMNMKNDISFIMEQSISRRDRCYGYRILIGNGKKIHVWN